MFELGPDTPQYAQRLIMIELEKIRSGLGLTQIQFSNLLGFSDSYYNALLNLQKDITTLDVTSSVVKRFPQLRLLVDNYIDRYPARESVQNDTNREEL